MIVPTVREAVYFLLALVCAQCRFLAADKIADKIDMIRITPSPESELALLEQRIWKHEPSNKTSFIFIFALAFDFILNLNPQ
jgi:hypothetical protein